MYSFKEKQKHFSELQNSSAATLDLQLLSQKNPLHPHIGKFSRNPKRYADEILYQLLDIAKRDEIRNNRRPPAQEEVPIVDEINVSGEEKDKLPVVELEKMENENATQNPLSSETIDPEQQDKITEVTNQVIEAEERAEEAEERAEEAELRAEEAEERADSAEAALEQEKKKVVTTPKAKVKSKSGKNIPKSTGTTSQTRKSKQPPSSTTTEL